MSKLKRREFSDFFLLFLDVWKCNRTLWHHEDSCPFHSHELLEVIRMLEGFRVRGHFEVMGTVPTTVELLPIHNWKDISTFCVSRTLRFIATKALSIRFTASTRSKGSLPFVGQERDWMEICWMSRQALRHIWTPPKRPYFCLSKGLLPLSTSFHPSFPNL